MLSRRNPLGRNPLNRSGKKASKLERKLLKDFGGGNFSVFNMREEMDGWQGLMSGQSNPTLNYS